MPFYNDGARKKPEAGYTGAANYDKGKWDVFDAAEATQKTRDNATGGMEALHQAQARISKEIKAATGEDDINPEDSTFNVEDMSHKSNRLKARAESVASRQALAKKYPDKAHIILQDPKELSQKITKTQYETAQDTYERTEPGIGRWLSDVGGRMWGQAQDPTFSIPAVVSLPVGGAIAVGRAAIAWSAVKVGLTEAAIEGFQTWMAHEHARESGVEITAGEHAMKVGAAAGAGAILQGVGAQLWRSARHYLGYTQATFNKDGKTVHRWVRPGPPPTPREIRIAVGQAINKSKDTDIVAAMGGDIAAVERIAAANKVGDDPDIKRLIEADRRDQALREEPDKAADEAGISEEDRFAQEDQAMRHLVDNEIHSPPGDAAPLPKAKGPDISDGPNAVVIPKGKSIEIDGKPVYRREVTDTRTDAKVFQFKGGADAAGATDKLAGVKKWDETSSGKTYVYEYENDPVPVIADGHQRDKLRKRLIDEGQDVPPLDAYVFRQADGWTPEDVRAIAAQKNMREGHPNPLDIAKVLRDRPDLMDDSMPTSAPAMKQARQLQRLDDEAFDMVVGGVIPPNHAAVVGESIPDKSRHVGIIEALKEENIKGIDNVRYAVTEMGAAPQHTEVTMDMFGARHVTRGALKQRAAIMAGAAAALKADKKTYAMLRTRAGDIEAAGNRLDIDANARLEQEAEQVNEMLARFATSKGRVSDLLEEHAQSIVKGKRTSAAIAEFVAKIKKIMEDEGIDGLAKVDDHKATMPKLDDPVADGQEQIEMLNGHLFTDLPPDPTPTAGKSDLSTLGTPIHKTDIPQMERELGDIREVERATAKHDTERVKALREKRMAAQKKLSEAKKAEKSKGVLGAKLGEGIESSGQAKATAKMSGKKQATAAKAAPAITKTPEQLAVEEHLVTIKRLKDRGIEVQDLDTALELERLSNVVKGCLL